MTLRSGDTYIHVQKFRRSGIIIQRIDTKNILVIYPNKRPW